MNFTDKSGELIGVTLQDEERVLDIIEEGLRCNEGLSLPIKATRHNAKMFYNIEVRHCIVNQDPVYFFEQGGRVLGFSCCSTSINSAYDMDKKIALGVITVVKKENRKSGIATLLRSKMLQDLKDKKIEYVLCDISLNNSPSILSCDKIAQSMGYNGVEISKRYECRI